MSVPLPGQDEGAFVCERCEASTPFEVPVRSLEDWTRAGQEFVRVHLRCKAPALEVEQAALA